MAALVTLGEGLVELALRHNEATAELSFGGDAANVAVMAARCGVPAAFVGRLGDDALGRRARSFWQSRGVDVSSVQTVRDAPTGLYVNETDSDGNHRFDYHRTGSAASRMKPDDLPTEIVSGCRILHVTGVGLAISASSAETILHATDIARRAEAMVSVGVNHRATLGGDVELLRTVVERADLVFVSDDEARELVDTCEPLMVAERLAPAAKEMVLTQGGRGATVITAGAVLAHQAPPAVNVVDAAGAGDALAGVYVAARLADHDPPDALRRAVFGATLSCRQRGCAAAYPTAAAIDTALDGHSGRPV